MWRKHFQTPPPFPPSHKVLDLPLPIYAPEECGGIIFNPPLPRLPALRQSSGSVTSHLRTWGMWRNHFKSSHPPPHSPSSPAHTKFWTRHFPFQHLGNVEQSSYRLLEEDDTTKYSETPIHRSAKGPRNVFVIGGVRYIGFFSIYFTILRSWAKEYGSLCRVFVIWGSLFWSSTVPGLNITTPMTTRQSKKTKKKKQNNYQDDESSSLLIVYGEHCCWRAPRVDKGKACSRDRDNSVHVGKVLRRK